MDTNHWSIERAQEELQWAVDRIQKGRIIHPGLPTAYSQTKEVYRTVCYSGVQPIELIGYLPAIVLYDVPDTHTHLYWRRPVELSVAESTGKFPSRLWTIYCRYLLTDKEPMFPDERIISNIPGDVDKMLKEMWPEEKPA